MAAATVNIPRNQAPAHCLSVSELKELPSKHVTRVIYFHTRKGGDPEKTDAAMNAMADIFKHVWPWTGSVVVFRVGELRQCSWAQFNRNLGAAVAVLVQDNATVPFRMKAAQHIRVYVGVERVQNMPVQRSQLLLSEWKTHVTVTHSWCDDDDTLSSPSRVAMGEHGALGCVNGILAVEKADGKEEEEEDLG